MTKSKSAPANEPRLPIKLEPTSNGEYTPPPLEPRVQHVRRQAMQTAADSARRLGLSRRDFLRTSAGSATVLLAMNQLSCGGGSYHVPKSAALDPAEASSVLSGDEFIFDVQTHHVDAARKWWEATPPEQNMAGFLKTTPQAGCGGDFYLKCFDSDHYLKEVFLDSDTDMAVVSALWGTPDQNPLLPEEAVKTRERFEKMEGAPRLMLHGVVWGKAQSPAQSAEHMKQLVEKHQIVAFKLYPVWSPDGAGYRLDDEATGLRLFQQGLAAGVSIFAIHKGLKLNGAQNAFVSPIDVGPAAKAFPQAKLLIYHSGFETERKEGPYDPRADRGVDALIRSLQESGIGKDGNVYAELGSVWRETMKDPDQAAHVLGKLLKYLGEDRILWGTDAIWYGSPQDQIQAFRAFEISTEFQERFGYPALTPAIKRKIFGLNAAQVYGVDTSEMRKAQRFDAVARARLEYQNDPSPSHLTYGPRTPRELARLLATEQH
jgi:predicted TIM-barrel fold metal-dependent hydrolase